MKKLFVLLILCSVFYALCMGGAEAANKFWWASCRTGGGDCLDGIDGNDLTAGDGALVAMDAGSTTPQVYIYRVYASSADESDPIVITPDSNPGTLRWHLINMFGTSFQAPSVDGYNRIDLSINSSRSPDSGHAEQYPEGNSTDSRWKMSNQISSSTVEDAIVGQNTADTLTNKTIDADDNTLQDFPFDIAWSIVDPNDADIHYVRLQRAITASSVGCIVDPEGTGESVVLDIQECDSNGDNCASVLSSTITCGNTPTAGTINDAAWAANAFLKIDIGTVTGTVKTLSIYGTGKQTF
jgi:hypothetical protein